MEWPKHTENCLDSFVARNELKKSIHSVLRTFSAEEQRVIEMMYGLNGYQPSSVTDISILLNISSERTRKISQKVIRKLRQPSTLKKLKDFL